MTLSSRDHILREVRRSLPADAPLPSLDRRARPAEPAQQQAIPGAAQ